MTTKKLIGVIEFSVGERVMIKRGARGVFDDLEFEHLEASGSEATVTGFYGGDVYVSNFFGNFLYRKSELEKVSN